MKINIQLVTKDRIGSTYVEPVDIHLEDDESVTIIVEAWPEHENKPKEYLTFQAFAKDHIIQIQDMALAEFVWNEARR